MIKCNTKLIIVLRIKLIIHKNKYLNCYYYFPDDKNLLGEDGVLLYPTFSGPAFYRRQQICKLPGAFYSIIFNVLGYPATQVPVGIKNKLPIGFQVKWIYISRYGIKKLTYKTDLIVTDGIIRPDDNFNCPDSMVVWNNYDTYLLVNIYIKK